MIHAIAAASMNHSVPRPVSMSSLIPSRCIVRVTVYSSAVSDTTSVGTATYSASPSYLLREVVAAQMAIGTKYQIAPGADGHHPVLIEEVSASSTMSEATATAPTRRTALTSMVTSLSCIWTSVGRVEKSESN